MKKRAKRTHSDLSENELIKKLRKRLWPLEIQLQTGWFRYKQIVDAEPKIKIYPSASEYPRLCKPDFHSLKGREITERVKSVRKSVNEAIRKVRSQKTVKALKDSGLTRDDYFHVMSRVSLMLEDAKKADYWSTTSLRAGVLQRILATPTEYEIWEPECSLFSDWGRNYRSVNENCTFDTHRIRDTLFELAFLSARRCAARIKDAYSMASVAWLRLAHLLGGERKRSMPAYSEEESQAIERMLEEAVSLQWAEQYVVVLRKGKFSDAVTDYAQSVLRSYVREKRIELRDGFILTSNDSSNEDLWEGIHALVCNSDAEGFVKLKKDWKRNNRRTGTKRSKGAARVNEFMKYVQAKTVGRGGIGMYRLVGEPE